MSNHDDAYDFPVLTPILLGTLSEALLHDWQCLDAQRVKIEEAVDALETTGTLFRTCVSEFMGLPLLPNGLPVPIRISPEGEVFLAACTCPTCQAKVNNLSVSEVVEKMHNITPFPPEVLSRFRERAHSIDSAAGAQKDCLH